MSDDIKSVTSDVSTHLMCNGIARPSHSSKEESASSISNFIVSKGRRQPEAYSITSVSQSLTCSESPADRSQGELFSGSICTQGPIQLCALTSSSSLDNGHSFQSCTSPDNKDGGQAKRPSSCFDLYSSSLSSGSAQGKAAANECSETSEGGSDLRVSTLNEHGSLHVGLNLSSLSINPLQSKAMRELSLSWKRKVEDEERIARALTVPCTGPYHRLYGMSRIAARDNTQRKVLSVESKVSLRPFTLFLCTDPDLKSSKFIVVTRHVDTIDSSLMELWGPWSTFACGVYFRQYFSLSNSQEPPSVIFNPVTISEVKITVSQNKK